MGPPCWYSIVWSWSQRAGRRRQPTPTQVRSRIWVWRRRAVRGSRSSGWASRSRRSLNAVLAGDIGQYGGPARHRRLRGPALGGELGEQRRRYVHLDDPPGRPGGEEPLRAPAGDAVEQQPPGVVGDGEAPLGPALAGDDCSGVRGGDRPHAGDLAGLLVAAEQGGQRHPHLHADPLVVDRAVAHPDARIPGAAGDALVDVARGGPVAPRVGLPRVVVARSVREEVGDDLVAVEVVQRAVQQPGQYVHPDLIESGGMAGAPCGVRHQVDPFDRCLGLGGRQAASTEHGRAVFVQPGAHRPITQRLAVAALVVPRIDCRNESAEPDHELARGEPAGRRQQHLAHSRDLRLREPGQVVGEDPYLRPVDVAGEERRVHLGHVVHELLGEKRTPGRPRAVTRPGPPGPRRRRAAPGGRAGRRRCRRRWVWPARPPRSPRAAGRPRGPPVGTVRRGVPTGRCWARGPRRSVRVRRRAAGRAGCPPALPHRPSLP